MRNIPETPSQTSTGLPPDWRSEFSDEHQRFYYVNTKTGECTWSAPTLSPPVLQRKPVPNQSTQLPVQQSSQYPPQTSIVAQERIPTPPPYQHSQNPASLEAPRTQQPEVGNYLQTPQQGQFQQFQQQRTQYFPPPPSQSPQNQGSQVTSPVGNQASFPSQSYHGQPYSPPPTPASYQYQPQQQNNFNPPNTQSSIQYPPPPQPGSYIPQQHQQNFSPLPPPAPGTYYSPPPQQTTFPPPQKSQAPQSYQSPNPSSSSLSSKTGSMVSKLNTGFTQLKTKTSTFSASQPSLAKWGKRAAIGIGAIGVIALGADIADGGLFDGGGGGDGLWGGGGGESLDANAAQLAMEQQGQENALMLLDPPGTEYEVVGGNSLI